MAFAAGTFWEVWATGLDANGGGFDTSATFAADGTVDANTGNTSAPVFSSASYTFVAGDVGAWIFIKSGTNSIPGWYKIVSVAGGKATLNAAIGQGVLFNSAGTNGTPSTVVGLATVGTPTSLTWGVDYSQQAAAQIAYTDMVVGATTTQYTSAINPVGKNVIGNVINVVSGATVQRVTVRSTSTITATCDKALGTAAQVGVGNLGGAFLSPAMPMSVAVVGNAIFNKTGAYSITSATVNIAGGCVSFLVTTLRLEGYSTIRGDMVSPPTWTASGISTFEFIKTGTGSNALVRNLILDGASLTSSRGVNSGRSTYYSVAVKNCTNSGIINDTNALILIKCSATGCSTQPAFSGALNCLFCEAYSNTVTGFRFVPSGGGAINCFSCLSYNNSGATSDGFTTLTSGLIIFENCVSYGNGRDGFSNTLQSVVAVNCIAESNAGTGINFTGATNLIANPFVYSNGTDITNTGVNSITFGTVTATGSFFTNAAGGDFSLNNTAGAGALARAAGLPGTFPRGTTVSYLDVGAAQHADPVSSSGGVPLIGVGGLVT